MVHIGAVDAPVTIDEVNAALAECVPLKQTELSILGWEWEMGINNLLPPEAKKQGVRLLFLQIPREVMEQQAVDKGDIEFFELAYLNVDFDKSKKLTARIKLKDFVIPNTELIPEEVEECLLVLQRSTMFIDRQGSIGFLRSVSSEIVVGGIGVTFRS